MKNITLMPNLGIRAPVLSEREDFVGLASLSPSSWKGGEGR